jgi:hypothetical protein
MRLGSGELVFASLGTGEELEVPSTGLGRIPHIHDPNAPAQQTPPPQHDEPAPPKPPAESSTPWVPLAIGGVVLIAAASVVAMALRPPARAGNPLQRFGVYAKRHGKMVFVEDHRSFEAARKHAEELASEGKESAITDDSMGPDNVVWRSSGAKGHHRMNSVTPPMPRHQREIAEMREVLKRHGYPTSAASKLYAEGMGPSELEIRCREREGERGSLAVTHGIYKVK